MTQYNDLLNTTLLYVGPGSGSNSVGLLVNSQAPQASGCLVAGTLAASCQCERDRQRHHRVCLRCQSGRHPHRHADHCRTVAGDYPGRPLLGRDEPRGRTGRRNGYCRSLQPEHAVGRHGQRGLAPSERRQPNRHGRHKHSFQFRLQHRRHPLRDPHHRRADVDRHPSRFQLCRSSPAPSAPWVLQVLAIREVWRWMVRETSILPILPITPSRNGRQSTIR